MVSFKNIVTLLIATISCTGVSGASVPRQYGENGVAVRDGGSWIPNPATSSFNRRDKEQEWKDYHRQTEIMAEEGTCRAYAKPTTRDLNWPCREYCKKATGDYSATCSSGHVWEDKVGGKLKPGYVLLPNPDGEMWTYGGECTCVTIPPELAEKISEGLENSGAIICSVWMFSIKKVLEKGSYLIPGGGPVSKVVKGIAKSVGKFVKGGKGSSAWASMVRDTCGAKGHDVTMDIEKAFDMFKQVPL
ncbi:uncharacterized protein CTRU02_208486 [Colletotrichum truncatum]|uniref:Uncharacterized protein n=1 Tax=Colletotrichum truncatum TaxID=5467 RepID=A0ACC3YWF1_COLTU|nr:uncharacterized protein CTRU02_10240 [Colletotrichum truncatum]KAF6787444.1 hypothetical protein CTRU02_10240 [Colletotrichum truncatum]